MGGADTLGGFARLVLLFGGMDAVRQRISLWDVRFHANTERFQGLVPLWSHLCPLSVRLGGVCGAYSESP